MISKQLSLVLLFVTLHAVIFMVIFGGAFPKDGETDSRSLFHYYSSRIMDGDLPYQDFDLEYAPLSLPLFLIPQIVSSSETGYHIAYAVEMLLFDIFGLILISALARQFGYRELNALLWATAALILFGPIITDHFDLPASIIVLFALYAFIRGWRTIAWIALAIGTMIKIFPIVIAPLFLFYLYRKQQYRQMAIGGAILSLVLIIIAAPCIWISPEGFLHSFTYHTERGLQIESTYASLLLMGDVWNIATQEMVFDHGAWHLSGHLADTLAQLSPFMTVLGLGLVYARFFRDQPTNTTTPNSPNWQQQHLTTYAILAIIVFLLANKVLSPQYIIWVYPLIALAGMGTRRHLSSWTLLVVILLTQLIYGYEYPDFLDCWLTQHVLSNDYLSLVQKDSSAVYLLFVRNVLLLATAILVWREAFHLGKTIEVPTNENT